MIKNAHLFVYAGLCCTACRPTAPPRYVPTLDEVRWEQSHEAEDNADPETAIDGYFALCNRPAPYIRACFDHARLLFEARPVEEARARTLHLIARFPDDGRAQSAVKRLAKSYSRDNAHAEGIKKLSTLAEQLKGTEIHDTILFEISRISRKAGDTSGEKAALEHLISKHDRWESQLWDDAVWRLSSIAREQNDRSTEKHWLKILLDADEDSWLIGSYTSPHHDDAMLRLGRIFMDESRPDAAMCIFDAAASLESSRLVDDALLAGAEARIALGRNDEACRDLTKVLKRDTSRKHVEKAKSLGATIGCSSR